MNTHSREEHTTSNLKEIAYCAFKLGSIGFGGIAGMVSTIENEIVIKRKWIDHKHFMDVVSASYIIPGPNAVEIVMHCGKERGGKAGLVIAGICYILPAMLICLGLGYFYQKYSTLPDVQHVMFGIRPATTALVIGTVYRLVQNTLSGKPILIILCLLVFLLALYGISEVLLILGAGLLYYLITLKKNDTSVLKSLLFLPLLPQMNNTYSNGKLFLIFFKIGAILYGSGFVLFAYMDESLVRNMQWLTKQQLLDSIVVGQITPGPILSSATFAGFLINGVSGGIIATVAIFLPSFLISYFLHKMITLAHKKNSLRSFLDGLSAASISIIAVVGFYLLHESIATWREIVILSACTMLCITYEKINTLYIILLGSVGGFVLLEFIV